MSKRSLNLKFKGPQQQRRTLNRAMQRQDLAIDVKTIADSSNSSGERIKNEVIQNHKNRIQ